MIAKELLMTTTLCPSPIREEVTSYLAGSRRHPLLLQGDAINVLREIPSASIDCCMTSPPYWGQRQYAASGIGLEVCFTSYIRDLAAICAEVKRVLKDAGSFWLNIGDTYDNKRLLAAR
jgi:DNA modification methylase